MDASDIRRSLDLLVPTAAPLMRTLAEAGATTLPVRRHAARDAASNYGALIAVMDPRQFIRLTVVNDAGYRSVLAAAEVSLDAFRAKTDGEFNFSMYNMPFLRVSYPSGQITGHEGRHRAARVAKAGGRHFPVVLYFDSPDVYEVTAEAEPDEGESEEIAFRFASQAEAEAKAESLRALTDAAAQAGKGTMYWSVRTHVLPGGKLRGNPERRDPNNPWARSPWRPEDIPEFLIGEFDRNYRVHTSNMRVGVLKRDF